MTIICRQPRPAAVALLRACAAGLLAAFFLAALTPAQAQTTAQITNQPASINSGTSATLFGSVVSPGSDTPFITFFYGTTDGKSNAAAWATNVFLGARSGNYLYVLSGLNTNTTYYFTAMASNSAGVAWAAPSLTFKTPFLAQVSNLPPSAVTDSSASLNGRVIALGSDAPSVAVYFGASDGGTNPAVWDNVLFLGTQTGNFSQTVSGLSVNKTYYYTMAADNTAGTSWATPSISFSTIVPAQINNVAASGITGNAATLNGQVSSVGSATPTVTLFYGPSDGGSNPGFWAHSIAMGPQTGSFSQTIAGLAMNSTYYFTSLAVNSAGSTWATPTFSFTTAQTATVTNYAATGIGGDSATVNGQVLSQGSAAPVITIYYGPADGGTNALAWSNSMSLGPQTSSFSQVIGGLALGSTNYFTVQAVNNGGTNWAAPSLSFVTLAGATLANLPASDITGSSATMNAQVIAPGVDAPSIALYYGTTDEGTNAPAWDNVLYLGNQTGAFGQLVTDLPAGTTYYYAISAENSAGTTWATPSQSFTTLAGAVVRNLPAVGITTSTATLRGKVLSTGGSVPGIVIYYGTNDGGTNANAWSNSVSLGPESGVFSQMVSNLALFTTYYYTAQASNAVSTVWASSSKTFTTANISAPVITNLAAGNVEATLAAVGGQVISTGGSASVGITIYYGTTDGGTNAAAWANKVSLGGQSGRYLENVTGLASNTTYYFTAEATNSAGVTWAVPSLSFTTLLSNALPTLRSVTTYHYDNSRLGVNTNETAMTLANVNPITFGRLFSHAVDGYVYAAPLIVTNVAIPGQGTHNVLFVATEHDSVYAFDADNNQGANAVPLWQTSFLNAASNITTLSTFETSTDDIVPEIGITSTPVIDTATGTLYVEVKTAEPPYDTIHPTPVHRLHALDITTGRERTEFNSPVVITCTNYPGTGDTNFADSDGNGNVAWNPLRQHCRPALMLLNGVVYVAFASHGDQNPYHGWLLGYNETNLFQQTSAFNTTPNGNQAGFWQGGGAATVDAAGNFYLATANGAFDALSNTISSTNGFGESLLKFSVANGVPQLVDFFTPFDQQTLSDIDQDFGSGAPLALPDSAGSAQHPHLIVAAGKGPKIYLLDRDNLGRYNAAGDTQIVQVLPDGLANPTTGAVGSYSTPAFFNNTLYYCGWNTPLLSFSVAGAVMSQNAAVGSTTLDFPGATPVVTANGTNNAIVWLIQSDDYAGSGPAVLRAYNATNIAQELYNSTQVADRDNPGAAVKFSVPTAANGRVYVGAEYAVSVFGNGLFLATPTVAPAGGAFTNSVTVTLSDATLGTTLYYTLDGSTPTTNSTVYSGPFVLNNSALVQVLAASPGAINSAIGSASFLNSSALGSGTGLLGQYYGNQDSSTAGSFTTPITLTRTDPVINFDWSSTPPDPSMAQDYFTVRWTGRVQPLYNQTYTFYTTSDDGCRLFINGQLLIDDYVPQAATTSSNTITLVAQQYYDIEFDYFQETGGALAQLQWSSPSTPLDFIPQSQLYSDTNPPPVAVLVSPTNGFAITGESLTLTANAAGQDNPVASVVFYADGTLLGTVTNAPYTLTATGLAVGSHVLTVVAVDTSGLAGTSAPVNVTINSGSGQPYGLTNRAALAAFLNMPVNYAAGGLPATLSQTGIFTNTSTLGTAAGFIPYGVNTPLWSDSAVKTRWLGVPYAGAAFTPQQQITFAPTGEWGFPNGTIFVKHFGLVADYSNPGATPLRLETRVLVRDNNGAAYGVTYKWRADNSDADLLTNSLTQAITITNADGSKTTQNWYYPSASDCLQCHTPAASYVLGVKTRQLNGSLTYPGGVTDNQLRTLNALGILNPAIDEAAIPGLTALVSVTNAAAALVDRARSYLDANCQQCHRPGGTGPTFDARFDTPLTNQNLIYGVLSKGNLGYDNAYVVVPKDQWRSVLYDRMDTTNSLFAMPPLARNLIDTNAMPVMVEWINSLPGTNALAPPVISPAGGSFLGSVSVTLTPPDSSATMHYTLDGSLPTVNSPLYSAPITVTNSVTLNANTFEAGYINSVAATASFVIQARPKIIASGYVSPGVFQVEAIGSVGNIYVLQASTNFTSWINVATNTPTASPFFLRDTGAVAARARFYRLQEH